MSSRLVRTSVRIVFAAGPVSGKICARYGNIKSVKGTGPAGRDKFRLGRQGGAVLVEVESKRPGAGSQSPIVQVEPAGRQGFSFFLRDVQSQCPIFIPALGVAVTPKADGRSYEEIEKDIRSRALRTKLQTLQSQPEETYEQAAAVVRDQICPAWLGLSRDVRNFEINFEGNGQWDHFIVPRFHWLPVTLPELDGQAVRFNFMVGRGIGVTRDITRRLDEGCLPILHARIIDEEVRYDCTTFVSLERRPLTEKNVAGTHYLVADSCQFGTRLTDEQKKVVESLRDSELHRDEETVLYFRCVATNPTAAPRYAFFRSAVAANQATWVAPAVPVNGVFPATGRVYAVQKFNGRPAPQEEMAVLLMPGESATFEFHIPHEPISPRRAKGLAAQDFGRRLDECRRYWRAKLDRAGQIRLPERRIEEMLQAGQIHLDLITYGRQRGPLGICVGRYGPIGSESGTIAQFFESVGRHDVAERSLDYFLAKQRPDGFIQNYENFMLETGPVLWVIARHVRYTRNTAWLRRIAPKVIKACDYLTAWHKRNCLSELKGRGYGLLEGKVADPEDAFRTFMLNGYACVGLKSAAEVLRPIAPAAAARIGRTAKRLRGLVRQAFFEAVSRSPVVPASDGAWIPTVGPWAEAAGPVCLYADVFNAYTHGSFVSRDSLVGPGYLIFQEVLDPAEPAADWLMNLHAEMETIRNAAFSEPYYDPYLHAHLARGEVEAFLKGYYNTFPAIADRQTYTFWEHLFQASVHKTSEEAWFLLQTRWMLYMEQGDTLRLLPGVPRRWLADGQKIELQNVASEFGKLSLSVESHVAAGSITARIVCPKDRHAKRVEIRLPHPDGRRADRAIGGRYDARRETVIIENFAGQANVEVRFDG